MIPDKADEVNLLVLPDGGLAAYDVLGIGISGIVLQHKHTNEVVKVPHGLRDQAPIDNEISIYQRLSASENDTHILKFLGVLQYGSGLTALRLELAPNGSLNQFLMTRLSEVDDHLRLRWAIQITQALSFIHGHNIIHGDLTNWNILLTSDLDARLADFAGSSMDGAPLEYVIRASHKYPGPCLSTAADIFALGCVLYHIATGKIAFEDEGTDVFDVWGVIEKQIERGGFPDTEHIRLLGPCISKCWHNKYPGAKDIFQDLQMVRISKPRSTATDRASS